MNKYLMNILFSLKYKTANKKTIKSKVMLKDRNSFNEKSSKHIQTNAHKHTWIA